MEKTSKEFMGWLGLQVGDKVEIHNDIYEVKQSVLGTIYLRNDFLDDELEIVDLLDKEYEILPRPKRVGDLKCNDDCYRNNCKCPLRTICHRCSAMDGSKTLYEFLEHYKTMFEDDIEFDQEIYDLLKARLDKVVE